jgi:hypothetical protein
MDSCGVPDENAGTDTAAPRRENEAMESSSMQRATLKCDRKLMTHYSGINVVRNSGGFDKLHRVKLDN